ncbi:HXXEE domain-containing protein [Rhizobium cremeum]|uniref:HXXEE domain-containing protein n=1 Tax=Rhizobium cremeum TaxID=2813827 RepID=UPI001FD35AD0|nr:HXXEE domain-containing protein [Rhizobium cremeum]
MLAILAWLAMAAYAAHVLEEYTLDWRNWARAVIGLPVEWSDFFVTNSVVVALGIAAAMLAETFPFAVLTYAALMLVNAVFFHILPFLRTGGRFSPGLFTAVTMFLPLGLAVMVEAIRSGTAGPATIVLAFVGGGLLMAYPVVLLKLKDLPYFRQSSEEARG